jgi:hypothetical protein
MPARTPIRGKVFKVGVTGHRPNRMPAAEWDRIKADLARTMDRIAAGHPGKRGVLLSGLAEGADRLAAGVALGRGWKLAAILAFHRTRFEEDFPAPYALGEFRALLAASSAVEEPARRAHLGRPAEDGYHAVGQSLLDQSDALIAVWDGEGSRGKGGTVDVMDEARARGIPVVWVHASKPQKPKWLAPARRTAGRRSRPSAG